MGSTGQEDLEKWNRLLQENYSIVALENGVIAGFGDIDKTGYLDHLLLMLLIRAKVLQRLSVSGWNRLGKEILPCMLPLRRNLSLPKEAIKL